MKKVIFVIALNFFAFFEASSQQFTQIYQAPLLLNPSFAGSTGGGRIAAVTSFGRRDEYRTQGNYLSYDHLIKKIGTGIGGGFYTGRFVKARPKSSYHTIYPDIPNMIDFGGFISIAPKFTLKRRDGSKRATLSPSLSIGYSQSDFKKLVLFDDGMPEDEHLEVVENRLFIQRNIPFSKETQFSSGLLYNSDKLIFGFTFQNRWISQDFQYNVMLTDSSKKFLYFTHTGDSIPDYGYPDMNIKHSVRKVSRTIQNFDFHFTKIIKVGSSRLSIVPTINVGVTYFQKNSWEKVYLHRINTFLQVNYSKVLLGGGLSTNVPRYSIFAGYKNDKVKLMVSYNFFRQTFPDFNNRHIELSVHYNLNFKRNR